MFDRSRISNARVLQPGSLLYVTGTANNAYARALSAADASAAGFRVIGTRSMIEAHVFGVQRATTGGVLNTNSSTTTIYQVLSR